MAKSKPTHEELRYQELLKSLENPIDPADDIVSEGHFEKKWKHVGSIYSSQKK